jgi:hypothetical protein
MVMCTDAENFPAYRATFDFFCTVMHGFRCNFQFVVWLEEKLSELAKNDHNPKDQQPNDSQSKATNSSRSRDYLLKN